MSLISYAYVSKFLQITIDTINKSRLSNILKNSSIAFFQIKTKFTLLITEIKISITRGKNYGRQNVSAAKIPGGGGAKMSKQRIFHEAKFPYQKMWKNFDTYA